MRIAVLGFSAALYAAIWCTAQAAEWKIEPDTISGGRGIYETEKIIVGVNCFKDWKVFYASLKPKEFDGKNPILSEYDRMSISFFLAGDGEPKTDDDIMVIKGYRNVSGLGLIFEGDEFTKAVDFIAKNEFVSILIPQDGKLLGGDEIEIKAGPEPLRMWVQENCLAE